MSNATRNREVCTTSSAKYDVLLYGGLAGAILWVMQSWILAGIFVMVVIATIATAVLTGTNADILELTWVVFLITCLPSLLIMRTWDIYDWHRIYPAVFLLTTVAMGMVIGFGLRAFIFHPDPLNS